MVHWDQTGDIDKLSTYVLVELKHFYKHIRFKSQNYTTALSSAACTSLLIISLVVDISRSYWFISGTCFENSRLQLVWEFYFIYFYLRRCEMCAGCI